MEIIKYLLILSRPDLSFIWWKPYIKGKSIKQCQLLIFVDLKTDMFE